MLLPRPCGRCEALLLACCDRFGPGLVPPCAGGRGCGEMEIVNVYPPRRSMRVPNVMARVGNFPTRRWRSSSLNGKAGGLIPKRSPSWYQNTLHERCQAPEAIYALKLGVRTPKTHPNRKFAEEVSPKCSRSPLRTTPRRPKSVSRFYLKFSFDNYLRRLRDSIQAAAGCRRLLVEP